MAAGNYEFKVVVTAGSREEAEQVMAERINHDEDYGFDYMIGWEKPDEPKWPAHDTAPCIVNREHIRTQRHPHADCPMAEEEN